MSDAARGPGTDEGCWVRTRSIVGCSDPRGGRPGAHIVLDEQSAKVVAFEFAAGDELTEHAAHHPVIIQVVRGRVSFTLPDRTISLQPGELLHLTPKLRHAVLAHEPTTLTVTMLRGFERRGSASGAGEQWRGYDRARD